MRIKIAQFLLCIALVLLVSCGGGLSREKAAELIASNGRFQSQLKAQVDSFDWTPIADRQFIEVTGISEEGNTAKVTFTYQWIPLKGYEEMRMNKGPQTGTANFQKFDDGWRVGFMESNGFPIQ